MEESPATRGDLSTAGDAYFDGDDWGWQPLWLSRAEVLAACREAFGIEPDRSNLLHEGMLNQSWRISASDHDRVLRISRTERTVEQVTYEHRLARAWAEVEPAVVVAEHDTVPVVDGHALTLFPFVAGCTGHGGRRASPRAAAGARDSPGCTASRSRWTCRNGPDSRRSTTVPAGTDGTRSGPRSSNGSATGPTCCARSTSWTVPPRTSTSCSTTGERAVDSIIAAPCTAISTLAISSTATGRWSG